MANELKKYDLIFFGEYHDNTTLHKLERELLPLLDTKKGTDTFFWKCLNAMFKVIWMPT